MEKLDYLKGIEHERNRWKTKIKDKIKEIDELLEYNRLYGNTRTRDELETKKEHFLEILEG